MFKILRKVKVTVVFIIMLYFSLQNNKLQKFVNHVICKKRSKTIYVITCCVHCILVQLFGYKINNELHC